MFNSRQENFNMAKYLNNIERCVLGANYNVFGFQRHLSHVNDLNQRTEKGNKLYVSFETELKLNSVQYLYISRRQLTLFTELGYESLRNIKKYI